MRLLGVLLCWAEFSTRVEKQILDMQTKSENTKMEVRFFFFLSIFSLFKSHCRRPGSQVNDLKSRELSSIVLLGISSTNADPGVGDRGAGWDCIENSQEIAEGGGGGPFFYQN